MENGKNVSLREMDTALNPTIIGWFMRDYNNISNSKPILSHFMEEAIIQNARKTR